MNLNAKSEKPANELGKEIKTFQYFTLGFGCIIGIAWVILMGEWLKQAGPLGAILAFIGGTVFMLFVGFCYAEVATMLPAAGGDVVFAYEISGSQTSFAIGWFLALSSIATNAFEALSAGWILNFLFPSTKGIILYSFGGEEVRLGGLVIAVGGTALLAVLNYRGVKLATMLQDIFTYALLVFSLLFFAVGATAGKMSNMEPLFAKSGTGPALGGILSVLILVPFFLSGFEVIPQTLEEKSAGTSLKSAGKVILISIGAACIYYVLCILAVSIVAPWKNIVSLELPTAGAFQIAFRSSFSAKIVLLAGLFGIITTWNTCFIIATRIIFALGRAQILPGSFGKIHPVFKTPFVSVIFIGVMSSLGIFLGKKAIMPVVNVAAVTIALAYASTCVVFIKLRLRRPNQHRPYRAPGDIATGIVGLFCCSSTFFLALYQPFKEAQGRIPLEWILLIIWLVLGIIFWICAGKSRSKISESERYKLLLGASASLDRTNG